MKHKETVQMENEPDGMHNQRTPRETPVLYPTQSPLGNHPTSTLPSVSAMTFYSTAV